MHRIALLIALFASTASAGSFTPILDADLRGGYSTVSGGGDGAGGALGNLFVLPAYRLSAGSMILPIYAFEGTMYNRVVEEDILYLHKQTHAGSLGFKQKFDGFDAKVAFDATYALTKESRGEKLGDGLYDYRDFGGRIGAGIDSLNLNVGLRGYRRSYVHFFSVASRSATLAALNPAAAAQLGTKESRPKDFDGLELTLGWKAKLSPALKAQAEYGGGLRSYRDKYLRTTQGAVTDKLRLDHLHRFAGGASLGQGTLVPDASVEFIFNGSNASVYDSKQPVHGYVPHFFQFWSAGIEPGLTWKLPFAGGKPRVRFAGGVNSRSYPFRYAMDKNGNYTDTKQRDLEFTYGVSGAWPLTKWLAGTVGFGGRVQTSNSKFEQYIQTNYSLLTASAGVSLSF